MSKLFKRSALLTMVFMLSFSLGVYAWLQTIVSFFNESVSFSLSGTYTKYIYADGTHKWDPYKPDTGTLTVQGTAKGTGNAFVEIVSGKAHNSDFAPSRDGGQIGVMRRLRHLPMIPLQIDEKGKCIVTRDTVTDLPLDPGTYKWNAIGKFEIQGARFSFILGWDFKAATSYSKRGKGEWKIVHKKVPADDSGSGDDDEDDDEDDEDDDNENEGGATVPDSPSFNLTAYRIAILLRWEDADDGGSPITGYEYQYQSGNYNRKVWSEWSEWTSAGTGNSTWITGLNSGVNYAVRMRAVNDIGYSRKTGIDIIKTKQ